MDHIHQVYLPVYSMQKLGKDSRGLKNPGTMESLEVGGASFCSTTSSAEAAESSPSVTFSAA